MGCGKKCDRSKSCLFLDCTVILQLWSHLSEIPKHSRCWETSEWFQKNDFENYIEIKIWAVTVITIVQFGNIFSIQCSDLVFWHCHSKIIPRTKPKFWCRQLRRNKAQFFSAVVIFTQIINVKYEGTLRPIPPQINNVLVHIENWKLHAVCFVRKQQTLMVTNNNTIRWCLQIPLL